MNPSSWQNLQRTRVLLGTLPGGADVLVTLFEELVPGVDGWRLAAAEIATRDPSDHRWNPPATLTEEF